MIKTLYLHDLLSSNKPVKDFNLILNSPYLVIGVEKYTYYDEYDEREIVIGEYDINELNRFNVVINLLGIVKNPRYLGEEGHMLQVALVTFKGK